MNMPVAPPPRGPHPALRRALAAEWTKLRTLRSTFTMLGGAALAAVALGAVVCSSEVSRWDELSALQRAEFDAPSTALVGLLLMAPIVGALGVRAIAGEHASGMIAATYAALPDRRLVVAAKALVVAAATLPTALAANTIALIAGARILEAESIGLPVGHPDARKAIVLGAAGVTAIAVAAVGLGGLLRRSVLATTTLATAVVGSQFLAVAVPSSARPYLPGSALQATVTAGGPDGLLSPIGGLAVLVVLAAIVLGAAVIAADRPASDPAP